MIASNEFGLGKFKLIESSEQGMLAEVARANASKTPIVFLGWEPHPMNLKFPVRYLSGGDPVFGPNSGGAVVNTNVRAGYAWRWRAWLQRFPRVPTMINTLPYTPR